jgi:aminopeptidase N
LNEGFATWIQYICVNYCFPEWKIWNYYAVNHLASAFDLDSLKSSHPIEVEIGAPTEITQIFDDISYCKGSAVLRMLNDYVGEANFCKGLHNYLDKHRFKNAVSEDLWTEIDAASNKPVKSLMQVWTKKQGYPVVEVYTFDFTKKNVIYYLQ